MGGILRSLVVGQALVALAVINLEFAAVCDRPDPDVLAAMQRTGKGEATRLTSEGGYWYSFALEQDSAFTWPRGGAIVVTLRDSTSATSLEAMAMSPPPEQRIVRLTGGTRLEPGSLWRRQFRNHGVRTVIFARFAHPFAGREVFGTSVHGTPEGR